jgi:hypothetical protein
VSKETYCRGKRDLLRRKRNLQFFSLDIPEEGKVDRNLVTEIFSHISDRFVEPF